MMIERSLNLRSLASIVLMLLAAVVPSATGQQLNSPPDAKAQVDQIFHALDRKDGPGCAVGVGIGASTVLVAAYGMADLEHNVPLTPESVFESGSVAKQFTAAAILLLAQQGKLSLDDPIRKYIPELPDYTSPITIRYLINHTSGLRDWGSVASLSGQSRWTTIAYSNQDALEITARQRALNYSPGSVYSYTNTGYNLLAIIVSRVSGKSLSEFSREAIFAPLEMNSSQWRDDFRRIVPNRVVAYARDGAGFRMFMPFETAYGNGGMLTTVGDLLRWNRNFTEMTVGGRSFVDAQHQQGRLSDGRVISYAAGLFVSEWQGLREVSHSGSTAGYQAWLGSFPDQKLSVAVLCNGPVAASPTQLGHQVANVYLTDVLKARPPTNPPMIDVAALQRKAGLYRSIHDHRTVLVGHADGGLRVIEANDQTPLIPLTDRLFTVADNDARVEFENDSRMSVRAMLAESILEKVPPANPSRRDLEMMIGDYASDEAGTILRVALDGERLAIIQESGAKRALTPTYQDGFASSLGSVRFIRNSAGQITELSVGSQRVWDMRFPRVSTQGP